MVRLLKPKVRIQTRIFKRWMKRVGIVLFLLVLLVGISYLIFKSDFFIIKNVNCWAKEKTSLADEKRWCEAAERLLLGKRIVIFKLPAVAPKLKTNFLPVGEVVIKKKYPRTVLVQIAERKPIAKVCPPGGREFLIDKEGVIYAEVQPESKNLKKVALELGLELTLGQTVGKDIVRLILLEDPRVKSIKYVDQKGIEVQAEENLAILFLREKNLEAQVRSLQMIVKKYKIEGKGLKLVDLRYDQPVVRY